MKIMRLVPVMVLLLVLLGIAVIASSPAKPALAAPHISGATIDTYLTSKGSPLAGLGEAFVASGRRHDIDPRLLAAIAGAESTFGKAYVDAEGNWLGPFSPPCLCNQFNVWNWFYGGPRNSPFSSYEEGIERVADGLRRLYFDGGLDGVTRDTIPLIAEKYTATERETWISNVRLFYSTELGGDLGDLTFEELAAVDIAFVIDVTGSMGDDIGAVKASATEIINFVAAEFPDSRIGLISYRDFPVWPYGGPADFPYRDDLNFTTDKSAAVSAIQSLSVCCGADWRESVFSALIHAMQNSALGGWRADATKVIILMGDAPPHDPEPITGYTKASVQAAYDAWDPVVYTIATGGNPTTVAAFSELAEMTGGEVFTAPTPDDVVEAILDAVGAIEPSVTVNVDIKPGSDPNSINLRSKGVIPVAILTTEDFDAAAVDAETVVFAGASPDHYAVEDVDRDGDLDLILHFKTRDTDIRPGDTEACLTGETYDGVPIVGCDSVRTVPPR